MKKSKCCKAPVRAEGFTTKYFVCQKCKHPTDILQEEDKAEEYWK